MSDGSNNENSNSAQHRCCDVSLLIPTKDRPHFLLNLLGYYKAREFKGDILIGDSSSLDNFSKIKEYRDKNADELNIKLFHLPDRKPGPAIKHLLKHAVTRYVSCVADDDFLLPNSIARCKDFLDSNFEYSAAHGKGLILSLEGSAGRRNIVDVADYRMAVCGLDSAAGRIHEVFSKYAVSQFSVCRKDVLSRVFDAVPDDVRQNYSRPFYDELIHVALTAALGKIAELDILYLVRLNHGERGSFGNFYSWITQQSWHPSYSDFVNKAALLVKEVDDVPYEDALESVNHAFSLYINSCMVRKDSSPALIGVIRGVIRRFLERNRLLSPILTTFRLLRFRGKVRSFSNNDDFKAVILSICDSGGVRPLGHWLDGGGGVSRLRSRRS